MFFREISVGRESCKIVEILPEHINALHDKIKDELNSIYFGQRNVEEDLKCHTYQRACEELTVTLSSCDEKRKYGVIGELLMHMMVPKLFPSFESMSVLFSLVDKNIKHGFDLNYHSVKGGEIWYGEVKSGKNQERSVLIRRARDGLSNNFENTVAIGKENTLKKWDAAIVELSTIYCDRKKRKLTRMLRQSRDSIINNDGCRNALIMVVNYGVVEDFANPEDIDDELKIISDKNLFDKCLVISARKEIYDDIVEFIRKEGTE